MVILVRITSWTRRWRPSDVEDILWNSENFVMISRMWCLIKGPQELSGTLSSEESTLPSINSSWISWGPRKAQTFTNLDAASPYADFLTYSKLISHVVCTASRLLDSYSDDGFAGCWLSNFNRWILYSSRYSLMGHWRALMWAPACSKARGRPPSSRTSSFKISSCPVGSGRQLRETRKPTASSSENENNSTQLEGFTSKESYTSLDSRLVVSKRWPIACLLHPPQKNFRIWSERLSWSTSSRTINHAFLLFER